MKISHGFLAVLTVLSLSACGTLGSGVEKPATSTALPFSVSPTPTLPPSPSPVGPTASASPALTPKPPTATPQSLMVRVFLIAVGDNGVSGKLVGCGDSAVPVQVQVPYTTGVLRASLVALLSMKAKDYGESGLYNSLYQSNLQVQSVSLQGGKAIVNLTGSLQLGGECDNPRVRAQLEEMALQFSTVSSVQVFLNGKPLDQVLSLK